MLERSTEQSKDQMEFASVLVRAKKLGISVDEFAAELLSSLAVSEQAPLHLYRVAHAMRGLNFFRAFLTLSELRLIGPAGAILRSLLEQHFVAAAISKDANAFVDLMETHEFQRLRALRKLKRISHDNRDGSVTDAKIDAAIKNVNADSQETNIRDWAKRGDCEDLYDSMYTYLCKYVHPSLKACDEHLILEGERFVGVTPEVDDRKLPLFVVMASRIALSFVDGLCETSSSQRNFWNEAQKECDEILRDLPSE